MHAWPFELAHALGAVPLLWLGWLRFRGQVRDAAFWWVAGGYFVSFLADTASHWTGHPLVSSTYPLLQAGLIAAAVFPPEDDWLYVWTLAGAGLASVWLTGVTGLEILLHTVAWLPLASAALSRRGVPFRPALLLSFGLGWVAWLAYTGWPGWSTWILFQLTRVAGTTAFCVAAARAARPHLILLRRAA